MWAPNYTLVLSQIGSPSGSRSSSTRSPPWRLAGFPCGTGDGRGLGSLLYVISWSAHAHALPHHSSFIGNMPCLRDRARDRRRSLFAAACERPPRLRARLIGSDRWFSTDLQTLRNKGFLLLMLVFRGLGVFNAVTTWIKTSSDRGLFNHPGRQRGRADDRRRHHRRADLTGSLRPLSQETPLLVLALTGAPRLVGITYATSYWLLLAASFVLPPAEFGAAGSNTATEVTYPTPEPHPMACCCSWGRFRNRLHSRHDTSNRRTRVG